MGELRQLLSEDNATPEETNGPKWKPEEAGWSVKPGQILVRGIMEPPSAWRWEFNPGRLSFKREELKKAPGGPTARQVWIFERGGMLYSIAEYDFYVAPRRAWD